MRDADVQHNLCYVKCDDIIRDTICEAIEEEMISHE